MLNPYPNRFNSLVRTLLIISLVIGGPIWCTADCIPQPLGLISWWPGDSNTLDVVGVNHGALLNDANYGPGQKGSAFSFTSPGHSVRIPDAPSLNPTNGLTLEGWVYMAEYPSDDGVVVAGKDSPSSTRQYLIALNWTGNRWSFRPHVTVPVGMHYFDGTTSIQTGVWYHVAMTHDNAILRLFVNGVLDGSLPAPGAATPTSNPMNIGGFGTWSYTLPGRVDELGLYNRALSTNEIQAIFGAGASGKCTHPTEPMFVRQPGNQTVGFGDNAIFETEALGSPPLSYQWFAFGTNLPVATNSTLLIANSQPSDSGSYFVIVTNNYGSITSSVATLTVNPPPPCAQPPPGLVSWWRGEGNGVDNVGGNELAPSGITYQSGKVGQALGFDGTSSFASANASAGLNVGTGTGFTIESWVKPGDVANSRPIVEWNRQTAGSPTYGVHFWLTLGGPGSFFANIVDTANSSHVIASDVGIVRINEFQHLAVTYDKGTGMARLYRNGVIVAEANLGIFTPQTSYNLFLGKRPPGSSGSGTFLGQLDEVSLYNRSLSSNEVAAIYSASFSGKCAVPIAPLITSQPANRSVHIGGSTTFFASASGSVPLSYQWLFNDTNVISGATNAAFVLTNLQLSDAGRYSVLVTNEAGSVTSSNALLTVTIPPATVRIIGNSNAIPGSTIAIPLQLVANGDENALGFSLNYNTTLFSFSSATLGSGGTNASLFYNTSQTNSGRIGLALALSSGQTMAAGTQEIVMVHFNVVAVPATTVRTTTITFGDAPTPRQLVNAFAVALPANYSNATVVIPAIDLEGDTQPRPSGNKIVTVADWVQVGRFVARLDIVNDGSEYQRADCAPRTTLGNGALSTTDWVQAGRYAAGLDALTMVGGPTSEIINNVLARGGSSPSEPSALGGRTVRAVGKTLQAGTTNTISIQLDSQGDENALGFSLNFDRTKLQYLGSALGSAAVGASLNFNSDNEASGRLGAVLGLGTGNAFAPGTREILKVSFFVLPSAAGDSSVSFGETPVLKEISDVTANVLTSNYENGSLIISPFPPVLRISRMETNVMVAWPVVASNYVLQVSDAVPGNWTNAPSPVVVGSDKIVTTPNVGTKFYRLLKQ